MGKVDSKVSNSLQNVREELVAVQYTASKWGTTAKGPRKMSVVIPHVQPNGERLVCRAMTPQADGLLAQQKTGGSSQMIDTYNNKMPKWNDQIGAYVLNFNKRVTEASVKNFQLISTTDPETVYLQFGRVGKEVFNLDFRYPISPFQAFAMCLSSFDYKLGGALLTTATYCRRPSSLFLFSRLATGGAVLCSAVHVVPAPQSLQRCDAWH